MTKGGYISEKHHKIAFWNIVWLILFQDVPEELVFMAERYEKYKREKEMNSGRQGSKSDGRRGGKARGQSWGF